MAAIKKRSEAATVIFMMAATVVSKLLGALRVTIMANGYGTGIEAQAFSEASHIPLTLFDLAFGAAILGCFIPVYVGFGEDTEGADRFAGVFLDFIILCTGIFSILGIIFADGIIELMAGALPAEVKALAARLLRIMFPIVIFTGSAYTLIGVMQSKGRYMLPAAVSAISNAGVIIYLLFIDPMFTEGGIYGLAAAYIVSWLIQLLTLAIPLGASGFSFRPRFEPKNPALIRALKSAPPVIFGSWLSPASVLCGIYFAAFIRFDGAVTIFDYANAAFVIIAGTLTYSIANYCFPLLSKAEGAQWLAVVEKGISSAAAVILPFTGATLILAGEGVAVLYMRGEFSPTAAAEVASTLRAMAIAMPAFAVVELSSRIFYSKKLMRIPVYAALAGIAVNFASSSAITRLMPESVASVGFGFAAGLWAAAIVMLIFLARRAGGAFGRGFAVKLTVTALASIFAAAVMLVVYRLLGSDPYSSSAFKNIAVAVVTLLPGGAVYLAGLKIGSGISKRVASPSA